MPIITAIRDTLITVTTGERQEIVQGTNLIVQGFGVLVAALLAQEQGYEGIQYWAVGQGQATWDSLTPPQRAAKSLYSLTALYDEIARVEVVTVYLDANDLEVPGPTNKIEVRAVFGPTVSGALREFGLFGGNATTTLGSGILIDHKAHAIISLNEDSALEQVLLRAIRITL